MATLGTPRRISSGGGYDDFQMSGSFSGPGSPRRNTSINGTGSINRRNSSLRNSSLGTGEQKSNEVNAEAAETASKAALEEIERDPIFSKFLEKDFNATTFASNVLSSGTAVASSKKLNEGIQLLERQLRTEVVLRHGELLQQLSSLKDTESVLQTVRSGIESLQASVQRVRAEISDPYKQIKLKTRQLASLHDTMELLRTVIKVLKQVKKLRDQMAPGGTKVDLAKAADLYNEIETLRREADLTGVEVVDAEVEWVAEVGQQVRTQAMRNLEQGMDTLNQAEVGSVLQVYYNMGELRSTVDQLLAKYKVQAIKAVTTALDMKAISAAASGTGVGPSPGGVARSGTPQLGGAPRARDALWQRMGQCMEALHSTLLATWHLQRVLAKKRDPSTHAVFLDEVVQPGELYPADKVWEALNRVLASQLKAAFTASSFVKETFVLAFPRLLGLVEALLERLQRDTDVKGVPPAVKAEQKEQLAAALEPFQGAYLGLSFTRLSDIVNSLFPSGTRGAVPGPDVAQRLAVRIGEEVEAVRGNERLLQLVLRGVGKALLLLADRAEFQVATGPDARQVAGPATAAQNRNSALCLLLQEIQLRISGVLNVLPPDAADLAMPGLGALHGVASDAITPLFKAMVERIENCILQVHEQSFGSDDAGDIGGSDPSSRYLEDVKRAAALFRTEFIAKLVPTVPSRSQFGATAATATDRVDGEPICTGLTRRMASRVLLYFVRHAALVRPLSEAGKLRMARDMAELEFAVGQSLFPVELLGGPYRALRAFRSLLFLESSEVPGSSLLQDIPPSAVLHHLYTRAPDELQSPIQRNNLTPAKYSLWLDLHGEEEAWRGIKATLDLYAQEVQSRGDKEFSPIYPLMLSVGQSLLESSKQLAASGS